MRGAVAPLWSIGWRFLVRHRWQSLLMVLGVALGVAVVVAIDLANASAASGFRLSTESLTGKATHQISGGPNGVAESVFIDLKRSGWAYPAAPVISGFVSSPQLGGLPMQFLGLDVFSDGPFRSFLGESGVVPVDQLVAFLTRPGSLLITKSTAARYQLKLGDEITIIAAGRHRVGWVAGLLDPGDEFSKRSLDGMILADISTAQELMGQEGWLTRIDLIIPVGQEAQLGVLAGQLPAGYQIVTASARSAAIEQMTSAFRVNLTALSLLALVVGLFLIYNTMTFSVVQRRSLFGTLRCLGVTRGEVFGMVLAEAGLVGVVGSIIGIGAGILLGQVTVGMVSQTITDLYYTSTVRSVGVDPLSLLKGALLGVCATLAAAAPPAWEAASVPPRAALLRSGLESKSRISIGWAAWAGVATLACAAGVFVLPGASLWFGFGGTLLVVLGAALLAASLVVLFFQLAAPVTAALFGIVGRLAPRNLLNSLSRTAVAVIALMVAVAVTVGVSIMIDSFRHTVVVWLDQTLQSDIYISTPIFTDTTPTLPIDPTVLSQLNVWPGVDRISAVRNTVVQSRQGQVNLSATQNSFLGMDHELLEVEGDPQSLPERMGAGGILLSEPLAFRLGIPHVGAEIDLNTPAGWKKFRVIGIYYDYASSEGAVLIEQQVYAKIWDDVQISAVGLHLKPGLDVDAVTREIQDRLRGGQGLLIRANSTLRRDVMTVFDRTFSITIALRLLATLVAFVGVLSALFLLQIEKSRDVGILRALGITAWQLRKMVFLETGLMGLAAGLLALPTGYAISLILIYVINKRSFGWTLQMDVRPAVLIQGVLVALIAALLAGVYPAWRLSRMPAAEAIRYE